MLYVILATLNIILLTHMCILLFHEIISNLVLKYGAGGPEIHYVIIFVNIVTIEINNLF